MVDDTERMLRDSVAAFLQRGEGPGRMRRLRGTRPGFERETWTAIAEAGWIGLHIAEDMGGAGLGFGELTAVMEELGRGLSLEPLGPAGILTAGALAHAGGDAAALLPRIVSGETIAAPAWQEVEGDHAGTRCATRATGERLTGTKDFLLLAEGADGYVVTAAEGDGRPELWWVEAGAQGVHVEPRIRTDGGWISQLRLDECPATRLADAEATARALPAAVDEARLAAAAELVGVMSRAFEITVDFVKQRNQFGKPIGSFQALQHRIVDLWTQKELARSAVMRAAETFDRTSDPHDRALTASAAKARCSDAALLVTRQAIQLHGGMGYTDEADIGLFLKRALVLAGWLGNGAAMRRRVSALDAAAA